MPIPPSPLNFKCPYCKAEPGYRCGSASRDYAFWYHDARTYYRDGFLAGHKQGVTELTQTVLETASSMHDEPTQRVHKRLRVS